MPDCQAEASREARAKIIASEGEQKAARALREASEIIGDSPSALQLRYLQVSCLFWRKSSFRWEKPSVVNLISLLSPDAEHHIGREELNNRVPAAHRSADVLHEEKGLAATSPSPSGRWFEVLGRSNRQHRCEGRGRVGGGKIIWDTDGFGRCASVRFVSSNRLSKQKKGEVQEKARWLFKWQRNYLRLR